MLFVLWFINTVVSFAISDVSITLVIQHFCSEFNDSLRNVCSQKDINQVIDLVRQRKEIVKISNKIFTVPILYFYETVFHVVKQKCINCKIYS